LNVEQGWIEAAQQGDAQAWEQLVRVHQQAIFRLAYLFLGDADDAEDIAQETFVRAYHALGRFDTTHALKPWLMRITTNLCHNWRRGVSRYLAVLQQVWRREPAVSPPFLQAEQQIESETLWKAVRRLRPEDQQVIYLRYFLECSEAETAAVISVAPGTVKSRQHRALARLRQVLEKDDSPTMPEGSDAR
jgi:RNA polymerase sigma-70 factor, ECF subfamily